MYLLDSSAIIELIAGSERGRKIKEILGEDVLIPTAISFVEVMSGAKGKTAAAASQFFDAVEVLSLDKESARESIIIEKQLRENGKAAG